MSASQSKRSAIYVLPQCRAIQNSDSNVLRERAAEVQAGKGSSMSAEKLAAHKKRTQELIQLMKQVCRRLCGTHKTDGTVAP